MVARINLFARQELLMDIIDTIGLTEGKSISKQIYEMFSDGLSGDGVEATTAATRKQNLRCSVGIFSLEIK